MCHLSVEQIHIYIYMYVWIKIEYQEPYEAEKTVWEGLRRHLSLEQIHILSIYVYIYMYMYIYIYIWIKIEYKEPHEAEKTVWVGMCHLSVEQIQIYIYMDTHRIPRTPRGRENGLGGLAPPS